MNKSAYIKLVNGSAQTEITLAEVKKLFEHYQHMTSLTGQQLGWDYKAAAFPYTMEEKEQGGIPYLLLNGNQTQLYHYLIVGVSQEEETGLHYIQIVLPEQATHGDLAKANEFCKYLAKRLKGELHLFNGRIIYYNPRK
ncbi:DUF1885 family protein [Laceyella putida]|uniref:DUF1885 family protein n=1 Tax=Laceyella putida TaxID=110101 RepID=A0ABW2RMW5_9BACL